MSRVIHTGERLLSDLRRLGVEAGDVLFVHSSYKSLGTVAGGAATVVGALEAAVGEEGLLLMPSFNLVKGREQRMATWDVGRTPSTVGYLTEYFRNLPGTVRSDHYSHSVAARGRGAEAFVAGHLETKGMRSPWDQPPWGATYGSESPMVRAYERGGKLLMLGVDYTSSTYIHLVEVIDWNARLEGEPDLAYVRFDRERLGAYWDGLGRLRRGRVGDAESRCFPIRDYVDTLLEVVRESPDPWLKVE